MDARCFNAVSSLDQLELAERDRAVVAAVGPGCVPLSDVTGAPPHAALGPVSPAKQAREAKLLEALAAKGFELRPTPVGIYIVKHSNTIHMVPPEESSL